jgi:hypothetical protein
LAAPMRDKPVYPNVRCGAGHPDAPGYIVCDHVIDGKAAPDPLRFRPPARDKLGIISCSLSVPGHRRPGYLPGTLTSAARWFFPVCANCARLKGWTSWNA